MVLDLEGSKIGIVGSGLIGSSWATIFASSGYLVQLYDINNNQLQTALELVEKNLKQLDKHGLQRGKLSACEAIARVSTTTDLEEVFRDAIYVQESALEDLSFRLEFYKKLDAVAGPETIIGSSTSTIPASKFTEGLKNRERCLIVHPVNPPLYVPLTELVPAPWTSLATVEKAAEIMRSIGQEPVKLKKEVVGFGVNRLQFAILAESWRLVADGVLSVEDVDKVMSCGLGPRYAFNGVLETTHLNAFGIRDYFQRYAPGIRRVLEDQGPNPTFDDPEVINELESAMEKTMEKERIREHQARREEKLVEMAKLKRRLENQ